MIQVLFTEGLFKQMELGPGFKAPDPNAHDFQVSDSTGFLKQAHLAETSYFPDSNRFATTFCCHGCGRQQSISGPPHTDGYSGKRVARYATLAAIGQGFLDYTDKELPAESPPQFGLHPNAEIGYLTNSCESLFKAILNIAGQGHGQLRAPGQTKN